MPSDVLDIDPDGYQDRLETAAGQAHRLAIGGGIPTQTTVGTLLGNAHRDALKLAKSQDIINEETIEDMIAQANAHAQELQKSTD
jgi:hypothetical protein